PDGLRARNMKIGTKTFVLEVAQSEPQQQKGLMKRDSLPEDHGMLFVFSDEKPRAFWMKNVRFPLDIVFLDAKGKVVSIRQMEAYDETETWSDAPAQYAIELNKNAATAAGVKIGDQLTLPAVNP